MKNLTFQTRDREVMVDITRDVAGAVAESGVEEGVCHVYSKHTTCGLTINENADPDVQHDILLFLKQKIPQYYDGFRHFEHNSDAHIKTSLMGSTVTIPFSGRKLALGRWQGIYLCEFDGPKNRTVVVSVTS